MNVAVTMQTTIPVEQAEAELIIRARQGQEGAWEGLMRQHQESVFRLVYLVLGDAAEAEDIAQEAFIRAYLSLKQFDGERPFRPWLLTIAMNLARNRKRSVGRYWANLQRWLRLQPEPVEHPDEDGSRQLWQAVQKLSPSAQEIIYLRYFLDLPEAETAETLHIAPGTVKSRLHRALGHLRTIIEKEFPDLRE